MADSFTSDERRRIMQSVRTKHTKPELQVRSMLHRSGFRFSLHRRDLPGKPDIALPKYRVAVFVHGCFWHGHDCKRGKLPESNVEFWRVKMRENKRRDHEHVAALQECGWRVFVIWQCTLEGDVATVVTALKEKRRRIRRSA